ncbi:MAG: excisionase family DNA-binding protein [Actinomycetota bacterium]|nr:excisionase family DNA-binding protein [Actinomycetota bacterium]
MKRTRLVTVNAAATRLGISRSRIYELIKDGTLESVKVGRLRRIPDDGIETYINSLRTGGQAA